MSKQTVFVLLVFSALGITVFYSAFPVGFVSDDFTWLEKSRNLSQYDPFNTNSYAFEKCRPGSMLVFALLYKLFSLNTVAFHLIILTFHILNAFLLFLIFRDLKMGFGLSVFSSTIFLIHFSHEETIFWVASLSGVFCLFFSLLTVWFQLKWLAESRPVFRILSILSLLLALSMREEAIIVPLVLLSMAYFASTGQQRTRQSLVKILKQNVCYVLPATIYVACRLGSAVLNDSGYLQLSVNPTIWVKNLLYFIVNAFVPLRFIFDLTGYEKHAALLSRIWSWSHSAAVRIGGSIVLVLLVLGVIKAGKKISAPYRVGMLLFFVALLPYLALDGNGQRFLYFSLVGASTIIAAFLFQVSKMFTARHSGKIAFAFLTLFYLLNVLVIQERARWWRKAGLVAQDIIEETKQLSASLGPGEMVYVVNLPRRLKGAYIFLAGYREVISLIIPDGAQKIQDLGFKDPVELSAFKDYRVYTYEHGAMKKIKEF